MSTLSPLSALSPSHFDPDPQPALTAELIDAVADAVVTRRDPRRRAAVICELIEEVRATLQWRDGCDPESTEMRSFTGVTVAADAHRKRMTASAARDRG